MSNQHHPLSLAVIVSGILITVLGGTIVAFLVGEGRFAAPSPTSSPTKDNPAPQFTTTPLPTISPSPQPTPLRPWSRYFLLTIPDGTWSNGVHAYIIKVSCGSLPSYNKVSLQAFQVSAAAPIVSPFVLLTPTGVFDDLSSTKRIETINPAQKTVAFVWFSEMTEIDAKLAGNDCSVTISWDNNQPQILQPSSPMQ